MKEQKIVRGADYYVALASKVLESGTVIQDDLRKLIAQVDGELGFKNINSDRVQDKFVEIFEKILDIVDIERDKKDRGRGKRLQVKVFAFNGVDSEEIVSRANKYFQKGRKRPTKKGKKPVGNYTTTATLSKTDKLYRDAAVKVAEELKREDPGLSHAEAMSKARKRVKLGMTPDLLKKVWKLLITAKYDQGEVRSVKLFELYNKGTFSKKVLNDWANLLKSFGIRFIYTIGDDVKNGRGWLLKFNNGVEQLMEQVAELAKNLHNIELVDNKRPVQREGSSGKRYIKLTSQRVQEQATGNLPHRTKYLIFIMGGIIKHAGRAVSAVKIGSILRNNHYHNLGVTDNELFEIVQSFPEYFERGIQDRNTIRLVGRDSDTWEKLQKFNPKNEIWRIPWLVNSGLTLDEIRKAFPDSYQKHEEIPGSSVFIIVADRSIDSFRRLAQLHLKMRDCDYPIMDEGLVERLNDEIKIKNLLLKAVMLDRSQPAIGTDPDTAQDKLLYQIEENYV